MRALDGLHNNDGLRRQNVPSIDRVVRRMSNIKYIRKVFNFRNRRRPRRRSIRGSETRLGDLLHFYNFSKAVATIILSKLPTF